MNNLLIWQIVSTILIIILGVILHFLYEWSGKNKIIAVFSAVNESTWEHLKLAFFPILIFGIINLLFLKGYANNLAIATTMALFVSISLITVFFYIYTGIIGKNISIIDISIFVIAVIIAKYVEYIIMFLPNFENIYIVLGSFYFITIAMFCFVIFTFAPPKINLFKDPLTGKYGI